MSLHVLADHMASKGRGPDSMLVHMSPREVAGLHALALKHGGSLTVNPDTGLPEAGFLDKLLPTIIGGGISYLSGGFIDPMTAAAMVGGVETIRTGSLERGLMAGFGAYGGAGLAQGFMGAGIGAAQNSAMGALSADQIAAEMANTELTKQGVLNQAAADATKSALANPGSTFSAGFDAVTKSPEALGSFAKDNLKYLASTTAPILADKMVGTTTKMPEATDTGYIRQKVYDRGTQTYRSLTPIKANEFKDKSFSDIYRGYDGGGIVALAGGGMPGYAGATDGSVVGQTVEDLYASIGNTKPDKDALAFWQGNFGTGPVTADQAASFMQSANTVLSKLSPNEQLALAPKLAAENAVSGGQYGRNLATVGQTGAGATAADTSGIATLTGGAATTGATTAGTSTADAQTAVNNIYRNVLGRDADATGLNFWSNAIANGRSVDSVYQDILASANQIKTAGTLGDFGIKTMSAADAAKPYTGYTSTAGNTIADEFVRNVLGREPTDADRAQSWYKEASNLGTTADASKVYSDFLKSAGTEASSITAKKIADAKTLLTSKGLTEDDVVKQTGKTIAQLVTSGANLDLGFMQASQLKSLGSAPVGFDFSKIARAKPLTKTDTVLSTNPQTNAPAGTTNLYGNVNNPGDITRNADGSTTVTPNIPGRPFGGFSGMGEVKNAYTQGGGSLGYTSPVVKTPEEHDELYNKQTDDSKAAYDYLMGKGKYPTKSGVGEIARPYNEATLGYAPSTNKPYNYDAATGKMVRNPDYVAPIRDAEGNVNYTMSINEIKKYLTANPLSGQALYDWAQSNDASAQDIADATGRKLSDVYAEFRDGAKKAAAVKKTLGTGVGDFGAMESTGGSTGAPPAPPGPPSGGPSSDGMSEKNGGLIGYAVGGGLGSLGTYSDGGRLLKGPGDGVSDSIPATIGQKQQPARLADGEFVVPARIVSELGNGSTDAGAKKLYAMLDRVQRARGKTTGKNKVAANSRADKYLPA